jgi:hypothetical protein
MLPGKICVPIFASRIHDFDPFNVPTISDLCREADEVFGKRFYLIFFF